MKSNLFLLMTLFTMTMNAQQAEVKKVIDDFFVAFHKKDTVQLKTYCSDKMILRSIAEGKDGNKMIQEKLPKWFKNIASIPDNTTFEERLLDYDFQVTSSLANVWTPYEFYYNGKLSHAGTNSFQLYKENGAWKIINLIDTRKSK